MKLANANENYIVPPIGRYKSKIVAAEATTAKSSGAPMIKITGEIREPQEYAGAQFFDNMITDESFKGSGFGKKKLRGLGVPVDSAQEIPDSQIAAGLLGLEVYVDVDHEQIMDESVSGSGDYNKPRTQMENGRQVPAMKLVPKGYYTHAVQQGGGTGGPPNFQQPGQFQQPPQQQQFQAPPQQQFQQPQQPQFGAPQGGWQQPQGVPQPQFGFPGAQPQVQQQFQQPQGQVPQQQFQQQPPQQQQFQAPPQNNGAPPPQQLPWAQQPPPQQAPQQEAGAGGGGGGRKKRGS